MGCCDSDWKREVVQDYKWEFVDVRDFHRTDFMTRLKYLLVYVMIFKELAIYGLDMFTAVTMLSTNRWTNEKFYTECKDCDKVHFGIAKWVFVGCIFFSFALIGWEVWKARRAVRSGDISYAYTNLMANQYFSIRNYDCFCLFCKIGNSKKKKDSLAFWVFFTFKTWKRTLLADGPRQSVNAYILYNILTAYDWNPTKLPEYWNDGSDKSVITALLLFAMMITVLIFLIGLAQIIVAAVCYIPLLFYIQGNLKEYVCHKVDKRISDIIRKNQKRRIQRNAKLEQKIAMGEKIVNNKGEVVDTSHLQPTLPKINLDDDLRKPLQPAMYRSDSRGMPPSRSGTPVPGARSMTPVPGARSGTPLPGPRSQSPAPWMADRGGAYSPVPQHSMPPQPTAPAPVTEFDIYDAYGNDSDDHSSFDYSYPQQAGNDASTTSLLGTAAAPGTGGYLLATGAPGYPPPGGAPGYPPPGMAYPPMARTSPPLGLANAANAYPPHGHRSPSPHVFSPPHVHQRMHVDAVQYQYDNRSHQAQWGAVHYDYVERCGTPEQGRR